MAEADHNIQKLYKLHVFCWQCWALLAIPNSSRGCKQIGLNLCGLLVLFKMNKDYGSTYAPSMGGERIVSKADLR